MTMRKLLVPVFSLVLSAGLLSCDNGADAVMGGTTTSIVVVHLVSGSGLAGLSIDVRHSGAVSVVGVTPVGPLASGTCQANPATGHLQALCTAPVVFGAPATVWNLTIQHVDTVQALSEITGITCEGSDSIGNAVATVCTLTGP